MKSALLIFLTFMLTHSTFAQSQEVSIKLGPELKELNKRPLDETIGQDNDGIYAKYARLGSFSKRYPGLAYVGFDLRLKKAEEIDLKIGKDEFEFEKLILMSEGLFMLMTSDDKSGEEKLLHSIAIDPKKLTPVGSPKQIASVPYSDSRSTGLIKDKGSFGFEFSSDKSKILILQHSPIMGNKNDRLGLSVFDNGMEELWSRILELDIPDNKTEFYDAYLTNTGEAVILLKVSRTREMREPTNYDYRIFVVSGADGEILEKTIALDDRDVGHMKVAVNEEGRLFMAGDYYSSKQREMGLFSAILQLETGEILNKTYKPFPRELLLASTTTEGSKKNVNRGKTTRISRYRIDDILVLKNGNFILLGEQYNYQSNSSDTYYQFENILVAEFSRMGELKILSWVEKYQNVHQSIYSAGSYVYLISDGDVYLFFNENAKNYKGTKREVQKMTFKPSPNENVITMAKVDENGKVEYKQIYQLKKAGANMTTRTAFELSDKELVVGLQTGGTTRYMSIGVK